MMDIRSWATSARRFSHLVNAAFMVFWSRVLASTRSSLALEWRKCNLNMQMQTDPLLKRVRSALRMTQREFGALIGRSHQSVALYEVGKVPPADVLHIAAGACRDHKNFELAAEIDRFAEENGIDLSQKQMPERNRAIYAHTMLDKILREGDAAVQNMILTLIEISSDWIDRADHTRRGIHKALLLRSTTEGDDTGHPE